MKPKTLKVLYWIVTGLFGAFFLMDGVMGVMRIPEGVEIMQHLGYPVYMMTIIGIAKIAGVVGIVQNKFRTVKEWAYAGWSFHFLGAFASRAFVGDGFWLIVSPILFAVPMVISYFLWKKAYKN